MAKLKQLKEQKEYTSIEKVGHYNIEYEVKHLYNPIICTNCNYNFIKDKATNMNYKEIINYDFCPKCGEKFSEFIDEDGNVTYKNVKKEEKEYREFIIVANSTYEEEKALIEKLWTGRKELIITGSRKEIQKYLDEYGIENEDYDIDDEYTIDIDDELFEFVGFMDTDI